MNGGVKNRPKTEEEKQPSAGSSVVNSEEQLSCREMWFENEHLDVIKEVVLGKILKVFL